VINAKALRQVLEAAQQAEDEGPCFCDDEDCDDGHEYGAEPATHVSTFVTPNGQVDTRLNKKYLGPRWGLDGDFETVTDPALWPDNATNMVVVDRATGDWAPITDHL
jgi:hypothetical protein